MVALSDWFVVKTHAGKEQLACDHLVRQGFEIFSPKLRSGRSARNGRKQTVLRPLFPGYVFISFDPSTVRWQAIDSTFGVSRLVRFGDRPARLQDGLVDRLKELSSDGYITFEDDLQPDDQVKILAGPFDEWIGQVVRLAEGDRVVVLLQMATRSVKVEIRREDLIKAA